MPVLTDKNGCAYWDPRYGLAPLNMEMLPGGPGTGIQSGVSSIEGVDISDVQERLRELFEKQMAQTLDGLAGKPNGKTLSQEILETLNREIALQEAELGRRAEMISTLQEQLQLANQRLYEAVKLASDIMRSKLDDKDGEIQHPHGLSGCSRPDGRECGSGSKERQGHAGEATEGEATEGETETGAQAS